MLYTYLYKYFQKVTLFGSRVWDRIEPRGTSVEVKGCSKPGIVHKYGLVLFGNDGKMVHFMDISKFYFVTILQILFLYMFYIVLFLISRLFYA